MASVKHDMHSGKRIGGPTTKTPVALRQYLEDVRMTPEAAQRMADTWYTNSGQTAMARIMHR